MSDLIAFCGIDCAGCKGFIATQKADPKMKKAVAEEWSKEYGHPFKPEDINCLGCAPSDGPHLAYCDVCEIRKCGIQKKVQNCAYCAEYKCGKLEKYHEIAPQAKGRLERIRKRINKK